MQPELTLRTATSLAAATKVGAKLSAMIGVDAFVDEIIRVVDKRISGDDFTPVERLSDLGARIASAAGLGTNVELVVEMVKLGGNGPIMANSLAALGLDVTCVGPFGDGAIHPAFTEMGQHAQLISLGEPGHTDALEFEDGKLMMGKHGTLGEIDWQRMTERIGADNLSGLLSKSSLVGLVNWTMMPQMNDIWERALQLLEETGASGSFFFDLADPEKRSDESVFDACQLLSKFQKFGPTILGLNEKEAIRIASVLGTDISGHARHDVRDVAAAISASLPIDTVVVHPRAYAIAASAGEVVADVDGPFTDDPKISTGAGDHFNAGFCLGKLLGLPADEAVTAAVGTSGYYGPERGQPIPRAACRIFGRAG